MTIMASDTTLTNASETEVKNKRIAMARGSSKSNANIIKRHKNYKTPIINK